MSKRIQIPVDEPDLALVKAAASRAGLAVAEWARAALREKARRECGEPVMDPRTALQRLFETEAPVADVDAMIEESVRGRLQ